MRRLALGFAVVGAVIVGLVLLRPVIVGPVTGDDVYYALRSSIDPDRTVVTDIAELPQEWRYRVGLGRVNVVTALERRISGRVMVETAVATGRPANQVMGVLRIGYAALSLFAVYALLRAIRWRRPDSGALVQMESRTRTVAMVAGGLAVAVGAQPQIVGAHGLNGWLSYSVSTWTAAFSIFGVVALTLWLARLAAVRGRAFAVFAALLLIVIGALSNYRYELTFPALPLTLLALALLPVSDIEHRKAGRRAKWLLGSAYVGGFVPVLVANRMMLSDACEGGACYEGVSLVLGPKMFQTFAINVVSSLPGAGREEVQALLASESVPDDGTGTLTVWSVLTALALLATLALVWRGVGTRHTEPAGPEETRAQALLCVIGAALLMAGGLSAAAVMSLSERSQTNMTEIGVLYRHSVITWTGLAFGAVLLVLALGLFRPRMAVPSFVALALAMALLVATKVPVDERIMAANTSKMKPTIEVFNEVVRGEAGDRANQRRCRILRHVDREMSVFYARNVRINSERAFKRYWRTSFCDRG